MSETEMIVREALERAFPPVEDGVGDWDDVLRRADVGEGRNGARALRLRRPRRRMWYALAAAALLTVLLVTPAFGLGSRLLDWFHGSPAPERVKKDFEGFNGPPPDDILSRFRNSGPQVLPAKARGVVAIETAEGPAYLWAAPTTAGGWCTLIEYPTVETESGGTVTSSGGGAAGCDVGGEGGDPLVATVGGMDSGEKRLLILNGTVRAPIESLRIRFADGSTDDVPFVEQWFLYELPNDREPVVLVGRDASGEVVAAEPIVVENEAMPGEGAAAATPERKVVEIDTRGGYPAILSVRRAPDGTRCYSVNAEAGGSEAESCFLSGKLVAPDALEATGTGTRVVLLYGAVAPRVASLGLVYEDGERVELRLVEGFFLYDVPPRHFRRGHLPAAFVVRDDSGRVIGRQPARSPRR